MVLLTSNFGSSSAIITKSNDLHSNPRCWVIIGINKFCLLEKETLIIRHHPVCMDNEKLSFIFVLVPFNFFTPSPNTKYMYIWILNSEECIWTLFRTVYMETYSEQYTWTLFITVYKDTIHNSIYGHTSEQYIRTLFITVYKDTIQNNIYGHYS